MTPDLPPIPLPLAVGLAALFGLLVGSFFNVIIYRMPRGESVAWPPSHCTGCGYRIKAYENIPIVSWLLLKGRCKSCGEGISVQYPLVEALTGILAGAVAAYFLTAGRGHDLGFQLAVAWLVLASIPIFVIDFRHYLIPDVLNYPGMILGLGLSFLPGGLTPVDSLVGCAGAGGFLWLVGFVASKALKKDAMGFGDVKLIAMAGALFGLQTALVGLIFASVLGTVVGLPMLLLRRLNEHRHIPFGPYICLGVLASAFWGKALLAWYFGLLGTP